MTDAEYKQASTLEDTQFSLCKPKAGQPCLKYDAARPYDLNAFLNEHGGNDARFDADATAHIHVLVKGEPRSVYIKPGSWLRCVGPCMFSACSDKVFTKLFELI